MISNFVLPRKTKLNQKEKLIRHRIFDRLISYLANTKIKREGVILPQILSPGAIEGLLEVGWTYEEIRQFEESANKDAEFLPDCEILQNVPEQLFKILKQRGDEDTIFDNRVVPIPTYLVNSLICNELAKFFSNDEFLICGIFYKLRDFDIGGNPCDVWRIDIEQKWSRNGFLVPMLNQQQLISGLRVFRHSNDNKPFMLSTRYSLIDYTKEGHG